MTEKKATKTPNPFRQRAAERRARYYGGQYRSPPTDRLTDEQEALIDFERSRVEAVAAKRRGETWNPF